VILPSLVIPVPSVVALFAVPFKAVVLDKFQAMATKMESLYADLAEYFVFDVQKYTLEEFMSDIKTFKNQFKVSLTSLLSLYNKPLRSY
jgi:hypothetical protein